MQGFLDRFLGHSLVPVSVDQHYSNNQYAFLAVILAIGTWLRFWGLDNVGLHGDEETMAMPTMAILDGGLPYLPSGMFYSRAIAQLYLMAASVSVFGESEWAFRFPSAVVGSLTGLAAFYMGRRFLSPHYNLAFVAVITFLPSMIEASQTARMYVFWLTAVIWFAACLFRWERDQKNTSLALAVLAWLVALHFHTLSIFTAPLFLYPGLSTRSGRQLAHGAVVFAICLPIFKLYNDWIDSNYPEAVTGILVTGEMPASDLDVLAASATVWFIVACFVVIAALSGLLWWRHRRHGIVHIGPILTVTLALLAMTVLEYHVAGILWIVGLVWWLRSPALSRPALGVSLALAAVLAAAHLTYLSATGLYAGRQIIGAVVGHVSVWPLLRFIELAPLAAPVYGLTVLVALVRLTKKLPIPVHFLLFAIAVWGPLVLMGMVAWDVEPRYTEGALPIYLLCVFAGVAFLVAEIGFKPFDEFGRHATTAALVLLAAAIVNPVTLSRVANPDYGYYPDHKGAAEYIRSLASSPKPIVIAEDVLQQTYYLGKVDYWLREAYDGLQFSVRDESGRVVDLYTHTELLGTGGELLAVLQNAGMKDVYIIGSGENVTDGELLFRGQGIKEVLDSDLLTVVYNGRDDKTKVWKLAR
jgi:hypothetical protein